MKIYHRALSFVLTALLTVGAVFTGNLTEVKAAGTVSVKYDVMYGNATEKTTVLTAMNLLRSSSTSTLSALTYNYDLQADANQRAAELALFYSEDKRPDGSSVDTTSELVATDMSGLSGKTDMINNEAFQSVAIGHVVCNSRNFWVAKFSNSVSSSDSDTTNYDSVQTVSTNILEDNIQSKNVVLSKTSTQIDVNASEDLPTVTTLSVSTKDSYHNSVSTAVPLSATVQSQAQYSWNEITDGIAKIDSASNKVTGLKTGTTSTVVTAKVDGSDFGTASYAITVKAANVAVESVSLNKSSLNLAVNGTETLTATVSPSGATNKNVTWKSSDESITTVSDKGVVTAKKTGSATITVTTEDGSKTATCTVTVKDASKIVSSVSLDKTSLSLTVGGSDKLTATISPSTADNKNITWTSSNKDVVMATGSSTIGVIVGLKAGSATITATTEDGAKKATCSVTVTNSVNVQSVALNRTTADLYVGESVTLTTTISPSDASDKKVSWRSNDETVATVNSSGLVTAKRAGSAIITVTTNNGSKTATCTVSVQEKPVADTVPSTQPTTTTTTATPMPIIDLANVQISNVNNKYVYSGSEIEPIPIVTYMGTILTNGVDYNITYINNRTVGTASIYLTGIGNYTGNNTRTFKIVPVATSLKGLEAGEGTLKVKWNTQVQGVNGYQIQYSLKKGMPSGSTKSKTVSGKNQQSKILKGLKSGKKYYVRIRAYGTVSGAKYYSAWSKVKNKKVK